MSQARGWSAFRDGLVNLSAVDPEWVAARLAPTGVYQTWFLFRRRCPGEELSTLAIKLICVEVLGRYELQLVEGQDLSECNDTALPVPTSGLRVRLRARE